MTPLRDSFEALLHPLRAGGTSTDHKQYDVLGSDASENTICDCLSRGQNLNQMWHQIPGHIPGRKVKYDVWCMTVAKVFFHNKSTQKSQTRIVPLQMILRYTICLPVETCTEIWTSLSSCTTSFPSPDNIIVWTLLIVS